MQHGAGKRTFVYSAAAEYSRYDDWVPNFDYFTDQERLAHWAIVD